MVAGGLVRSSRVQPSIGVDPSQPVPPKVGTVLREVGLRETRTVIKEGEKCRSIDSVRSIGVGLSV